MSAIPFETVGLPPTLAAPSSSSKTADWPGFGKTASVPVWNVTSYGKRIRCGIVVVVPCVEFLERQLEHVSEHLLHVCLLGPLERRSCALRRRRHELREHGKHRAKADEARGKLKEQFEKCWTNDHAWYDPDRQEWRTDRDWDHHYDWDRDHDRDDH